MLRKGLKNMCCTFAHKVAHKGPLAMCKPCAKYIKRCAQNMHCDIDKILIYML